MKITRLMIVPICVIGMVSLLAALPGWTAEDALNIGSRRELFVDNAMINKTSGELRLVLHRPESKEIVFKTDQPWEGNASSYQTVFNDNGTYRMYYPGCHYRPSEGEPANPGVLCYAESTDGIHWTRPNLGLCTFKGSTENNIIVDTAMFKEINGDPAHTSVFYDANPDCPADQRYKVVIAGKGENAPLGMALYVLCSGDGLRFRLLSDKPCVTDGAFDSQNLIFWDPLAKTYRAYYRNFRGGIRDIMTSSSDNILHFPPGKQVAREQGKDYELYTNQMQPYYRAPHIFLGFPMRYYDRGKAAWNWPAMQALPGQKNRMDRYRGHPRFGIAVTDGVLLASRDGETVRLWEEAFMRPGPRLTGSWVYGDNLIFLGMLETASHLGDAPNEISLYSIENYWEGDSTEFRRSTLRLDGFVSAQASAAGGELITKPLIFAGDSLSLNFETSGPGEVKVELQNPDGTPIPGYALDDCFSIFGDHIDFPVSWRDKGTDVRELVGKPICIRFTLKDADLYAFQFLGKE